MSLPPVFAASALYGQTLTLLTKLLEPSGVAVRFANPCDPAAFETAVAEAKPACVLVETVSNPLLRVAPIDKLSEIAHRHGAYLLVDATFSTPVLLRPLEHGADMVIHSATKFLAGHGDVLGGVVITREEFRPVLQSLARTLGPNLGPFESYLAMRGVKTLALRMERHCRNAAGEEGVANGGHVSSARRGGRGPVAPCRNGLRRQGFANGGHVSSANPAWQRSFFLTCALARTLSRPYPGK